MTRKAHPGVTTKTAIVAVVSTVGACGLGLVVYQQLVLDRDGAGTSPGNGTPGDVGERPRRLAAEGQPSSVVARSSSQRAALFRALVKANATYNARGEEPLADEGPDPADPSADEGDAAEVSEEELFAMQSSEVDRLETQLGAETADVAWATRTEQAMVETARLVDTVTLDEVTCRETLCRARVTHHDPSTRPTDLLRLMAGRKSGQMVSYVPDEEWTTVMYFSREGRDLPELQPPPLLASTDAGRAEEEHVPIEE